MARLSKTVIRAGLETLYFSGTSRIMRPFLSGVGAILALHHVRPPSAGDFRPNRLLEIGPAFLEEIVTGLRSQDIDLVSLDEVHRRLTARDFSRRFAALTFDDGYRDNLEYAWPILKRHGVPFTIFVASSFAEGRGELWWVVLERAIAGNARVAFELDGKRHIFDCATPQGKREAFAGVYWLLRQRDGEDDLRRVIRELAVAGGIDMAALCREFCLSFDEIAALAHDPLVAIGAHTVSHPMLRKVSADAARAEIAIGAERVRAAVGKYPAHLAFPVGDASAAGPREFAMAAALGFKTAVTTRPGVLFPEHAAHLTALPRISVNGEFQRWRYLDVLFSGAPTAFLNGFRRVDAA